MKDTCIDYQLAPPGMHRRNSSDRAIITFKYHFISGICTTNPYFPMQNWDCLLEQAEITLNLLRPSRFNPRLLAYEELSGELDFSRIPMAPPGTTTLVHDKPHNRGTWSPHGHKGWYVRPAMLHYHCSTSYIPKTAKNIYQTPRIFPGNTKISKTIF